ncbi:essential for viability in the presence of catechol [Niallia circulans]|uniref:DoxX family protein n=1 Tax=Shouchella clausii TaxID=79880 RepID=UPI000792C3DE|nr:DoxX family protein [Shouchella clausii]MCM3313589.1 DoxX family protein [Psychrobacillus sp. MER TA 17]SPT80793.1 essential for viability in the presence of catechol [Niallia circulans]KKI85363.1 oxidoreductase [Shouchella clausii]MBU8598327.1 DoxX family protein [Shouchella clausii]MCM3547729.1 DoxX family protein [Shouchella clausii]
MTKTEIGILLVRVTVGIIFLFHGLDKFNGGIEGTGAFFDSIGIPAAMASVVAFVEIIGGLALILGLGTRIIGAVFSAIMVVAIITAKWEAGLLGGYELDLILLVTSLLLVLNGSKLLAIDQLFGKKKRRRF